MHIRRVARYSYTIIVTFVAMQLTGATVEGVSVPHSDELGDGLAPSF